MMKQRACSTTTFLASPGFTSTWRLLIAGLAMLMIAASGVWADPAETAPAARLSDPLRYQGGVRNSPGQRRLNDKQQAVVLKSLREKTGYVGLAFDEDGFLRLGDQSQIVGGSQTARELLLAALDSENAFDLEAHLRSQQIAFARLGSPISYQSRMTGAQIDVVPVELDFNDFDRLRGDRQVVAAFDIGFVILHELAHGVLRLSDARTAADPLGECEAHINQIRRELNLPERQHYFARLIERASPSGGSSVHQAELLFTRQNDNAGNPRREQFLLMWEALQVGQIRSGEALPRARGALAATQ